MLKSASAKPTHKSEGQGHLGRGRLRQKGGSSSPRHREAFSQGSATGIRRARRQKPHSLNGPAGRPAHRGAHRARVRTRALNSLCPGGRARGCTSRPGRKSRQEGKAGTGRDASLVQWAGRGREGRVQEDVEQRGTSSFCRRDNSTAQPVTSTFREPGRQERPFCPEDQLLGRGCTITGTHDSALCGFYRHAQPYCSKESTGGLTEAGRGRGGRGLRAKPSLQDAKSTGVR